MTNSSLASSDIDPVILREAADWLVRLQSGGVGEREEAALARWQQLSPAHRAAWRRAEDLLGTLGRLPPTLGHDTLLRPRHSRRRRLLGVLALTGPASWLVWRLAPWQEWRADLATGTGERATHTLGDGTRLVLNTRSAVNILFTTNERRLTLVAGEILITTSRHDPSATPRPFVVDTTQGSLHALGTRFVVRKGADHDGSVIRLAVLEGAVEVRPAGGRQAVLVRAGEQTTFDKSVVAPSQAADEGAALWERGLLLARELRLDALVAELARYFRGIVRCDPSVAAMTVSGAFPVADTIACLDMLVQSVPIRVASITPYWLTIRPR